MPAMVVGGDQSGALFFDRKAHKSKSRAVASVAFGYRPVRW